ncbi:hypothetical protein TPER_HE00030 [Candidatus Hoaglandella endobia]|uniref:Uncharacterized protein n=1 Tax=Candidatus Hoaglandella endobia TaxID=1778263 RepID=A0A143WT95_9ENTR|nr:hypothetical protein TPER_HE00030 [Candidatus Hoaglandella endobia]
MEIINNKLRRTVLVVILLELYSCGLKGPLYFRDTGKADKIQEKFQLKTTRSSTQLKVAKASLTIR